MLQIPKNKCLPGVTTLCVEKKIFLEKESSFRELYRPKLLTL